MKILFLFLLILNQTTVAATLHLARILEKGHHFSLVRYGAFESPQSSDGMTTKDYLESVLNDSQDKIDKNYVLLRNIGVEGIIESVRVSDPVPGTESGKNVLDLARLKACAKKSLPHLRLVIFHDGLKEADLKAQVESLLGEERGMISGYQSGIICGLHMGQYGEAAAENPVDEIKLTSFLAKESPDSIERLLKIRGLADKARSFIAIKFLNYLKIALLVASYRGKSISGLSFQSLKEKFSERYLQDTKESTDGDTVFEVNNSAQRLQLEEVYQEVLNELH